MIKSRMRGLGSLVRKTNLPALIALSVVIVGWAVAEMQARNSHIQAQRADITSKLAVLRADLEGAVNGPIQLVRGLIATIETEPEMDQTRFAELASRLFDEQQLLRNVAAAPDLVIRLMYPIPGNEQAIGLDYTLTPEQRDAALRARDIGDMVLAGPVDLVQGGQGFVGRFPVFLSNDDGPSRFWGLVSAVMDLDVLYSVAGLTDDLPFVVSITGRDAAGAEGPAFFGPELEADELPVITKVQLPTGSWQLAAMPQGGWDTHPPHIWTIRALLLLAAALILVPSVQMGRLMEARQRSIQELETANMALQHRMRELEAARATQAETEARLRDSLHQQKEIADRFNAVADLSRSWIWEQDADLRFTFVSDTFVRLSGIPATYMLGRTRDEIYADRPETLESADWEDLKRRIASRERFSDFVYRIVSDEGCDRWLQISGAPIFTSDGHFLGYRGAGMEVTKMHIAREQAEAATRAKSMFLANMSHEIRTPLNGVLGLAETLDEVLTEPAHRKMVEIIRRSGEGLFQVLNDILDISKIEAGKMHLEDASFDPCQLAEDVVALHRSCCLEKGLRLRVNHLDPNIAHRRGDPNRVAQILHNLIGNAIKFTDQGDITVTLNNAADGPIKIEVRDTGIGMSAEQHNRIFEDFVQADGSITRRFGGTGLGMSIVRRLVSAMGGVIEVDSKLGQGTAVKIALPLPVSSEAPKKMEGKVVDLTDIRVLIADDMRTNQIVVQAMLRDTGAIVTVVDNGAEAVDAWASNHFDVVLLDISMPVLDGPSALAEMNRLAAERGLRPPVAFAFTANVMTDQISEYRAAGFAGCIAKPLRKADLLVQLASVIDQPKGEQIQ